MNDLILYILGGIGCVSVFGYFYIKGKKHEQFNQIKYNIDEVKKIKKSKLNLRNIPFDAIKRKLLKYLRK